MENKNWIVLTAGNQLCLDVLEKLVENENFIISTIIFDEELHKWKKTFLQKLQNTYKYQGKLGFVKLYLSKILTKLIQTNQKNLLNINEEIKIISKKLKANFITVDDLNTEDSIAILQKINSPYGMVIGTSILTKSVHYCPVKIIKKPVTTCY